MINKTKNYEMFKFREDNRAKVLHADVCRLAESIKARNLLEFRPILVNEEMEILEGQHRLLAAKLLQVDIYYQVEKKLQASDIIRLNVSKQWTMADYLNFYCHHDYQEYIKLRDFAKSHELTLKVALNICVGNAKTAYHAYKDGTFKFSIEEIGEQLEICWETINYIKKMNGYSAYTDSSRFWKAILKLTTHADFEVDKWRVNLHRMVNHFCPKASTEDYAIMMQGVYNWKNHVKINITKEEA